MSSNAPTQRQSLLEGDPGGASPGVLLLDDWDDFFDAVPSDLVFECATDTAGHSGGVAVYEDRVVLEDPAGAGTHCCYRAELAGWAVIGESEDGLATVTVNTGAPATVKVPAAYARALALALTSTFGASPVQ